MPHPGKRHWLRRYDWDAIAGIMAAAAALILHLLHVVNPDILLAIALVLLALLLLRQLRREEREERIEETTGRTERMIVKLHDVLKAPEVVLVGPQEDPDPELLRLPRVVVRPPVPFDRLPALAAAASVLVMPYIDAPVTRAMQPLKLKEYLATGKPAVVRDLPATRPWADCADLADTPAAFARLVTERPAGGLPEAQRVARRRLEAEGWAGKAREFEKWARGEE